MTTPQSPILSYGDRFTIQWFPVVGVARDVHYNAFSQTSILVGDNGLVARSKFGGMQWIVSTIGSDRLNVVSGGRQTNWFNYWNIYGSDAAGTVGYWWTSSDDGATWTARSAPQTTVIYAAQNNRIGAAGRWFTIAGSGGGYTASLSGQYSGGLLSPTTPPSSIDITAMATFLGTSGDGDGTVMLGYFANRYIWYQSINNPTINPSGFYDTNDVSSTTAITPGPSNTVAILKSNGTLFSTGTNGPYTPGFTAYSSIPWFVSTPTDLIYVPITGKYVAVGTDGAIYMSSSLAGAWTNVATTIGGPVPNMDFYSVTFDTIRNRYIAVGTDPSFNSYQVAVSWFI